MNNSYATNPDASALGIQWTMEKILDTSKITQKYFYAPSCNGHTKWYNDEEVGWFDALVPHRTIVNRYTTKGCAKDFLNDPTFWVHSSVWLERSPDKAEVHGSNPCAPIRVLHLKYKCLRHFEISVVWVIDTCQRS